LAKDFEVLRFAHQRQTEWEMQDYDDDIPGATRETVNGETRTLIEDNQVGSIAVTDGLALKIKGTAQKTVLGRVYALRDWDQTDGAVDGWKTVAGARLLPAGFGGQELEIPVWSSENDRWEAVTMAASDLLSLLGWSSAPAGHVLSGNGLGVVPTFQDLGAALGVLTGADTAGRVLRLVDVQGVGLVARWVSAASLTAGAGLIGSNYDGLTARSWTVDFGTGSAQAARGNHTHGGCLASLAAELVAANAPSGVVLYDGSEVTAGKVMPNRIGYHSEDLIPPGSVLAYLTDPGCRYTMPVELTKLLGSSIPVDPYEAGRAAGMALRLRQGSGVWFAQWEDLELSVPPGTNAGDVLVWDAQASAWVAAEPPEVEGSTVPAGTADGQILKWSAANSEWQAVAPPQDLGADVPMGDNEGDIICWDATAGEWVAVPAPEPATLVRGAGLTGSDYDTTAQQTWAADIGTGSTQVAAGNHGHDYAAGLTAQLDLEAPDGFVVKQEGELFAWASAPAGLINAGSAGTAGRVLSFGALESDLGTLASVSSLLGNYGPCASGVTAAAGLYLRMAQVGGSWATQWAPGVPDGAVAGQMAYWDDGEDVWAIAALATLIGFYVPATGTKAAGQVLQLANDLTAKWVALPSTAAENPGVAVVALGAWSDTADGAAPGGEAALAGTWEAGGENGLVQYIETRQRYYNAGAKKWYAYGRKMIYDKYGRLFHVTAETRWVVETPEVPA